MSTAAIQQHGMFLRFDLSLVGVKNDGKNKPPPGGAAARGSAVDHDIRDAGPTQQSGFDNWLNRKLALLYGPVLREPLPDELVEMIETRRSQNKDG